jgi:hypothetical protein
MHREQRLADTLVALTDTFVDDFDLIALFQQLSERCVELLDVSVAALLLKAPAGGLHLTAPCTMPAKLADLLDLAEREGPALECFTTATPITPLDLGTTGQRWPTFTFQARKDGYLGACALPLRARSQTLGVLLMLYTDPRTLPEHHVRLAQALANAATLGILHHQAPCSAQTTTAQLITVIHHRFTIEQAIGFLTARLHTSPDEAFATMRRHARNHQQLLSDTARAALEHGLLPEGDPAHTGSGTGTD